MENYGIDQLSDISKLKCAINIHFKKNVKIIDKPNWKFANYQKDLINGAILLFDSSIFSGVGFGELGELNRDECSKEKWNDAIGIIQYKNNKVMNTVIPKNIKYTLDVIQPFFKENNTCMVCKLVSQHVKIDNYSGSVICLECFDILSNIKIAEMNH